MTKSEINDLIKLREVDKAAAILNVPLNLEETQILIQGIVEMQFWLDQTPQNSNIINEQDYLDLLRDKLVKHKKELIKEKENVK